MLIDNSNLQTLSSDDCAVLFVTNIIQAFERELTAQVSGSASQHNRRPASGHKQPYSGGRDRHRGRSHHYHHKAGQHRPSHPSHQHHHHGSKCSTHFNLVSLML